MILECSCRSRPPAPAFLDGKLVLAGCVSLGCSVESSGEGTEYDIMSKEVFCHRRWTKMPIPVKIHFKPASLWLLHLCPIPSAKEVPHLTSTLIWVRHFLRLISPVRMVLLLTENLGENQINYIKGQGKLQPPYRKFLQTRLSVLQNLNEKQSAGSSDSSVWGVKHCLSCRSVR